MCDQNRYPVNGISDSKAVALSMINIHYLFHCCYETLFICMVNLQLIMFQPNLCYSGWIDTENSILDLYLIIFLSCMHIWNHIIISNNGNYISIWFLWSWYISGANVLTNIIIPQTSKTCYFIPLNLIEEKFVAK